MFENSKIEIVEMTVNRDSKGYKTFSVNNILPSFDVDAQPYTEKAAMDDYGITEKNIKFRCFTSDTTQPIEEGTYLHMTNLNGSPEDEYFIAVFYRKYEDKINFGDSNNIVFILREVTNVV